MPVQRSGCGICSTVEAIANWMAAAEKRKSKAHLPFLLGKVGRSAKVKGSIFGKIEMQPDHSPKAGFKPKVDPWLAGEDLGETAFLETAVSLNLTPIRSPTEALDAFLKGLAPAV
eukprot:s1458_g3.t1